MIAGTGSHSHVFEGRDEDIAQRDNLGILSELLGIVLTRIQCLHSRV